MIAWFSERGKTAIDAAHEREPDRAERLLGMLYAREVASIFSPEFQQMIEAQPEQAWRTIRMCMDASLVRAQA
ncbi:hypothetical protein GCM10011390_44220 [Aureimonas endophytica]|uniref:Uncharacterized protein n=2 Tax=Aureimonas endophytica TaxID=2027858 RepID=A0A916ZZE2_9HYPH|nr:hypothetical protein GCM10011390_44220 [Aureimonas endophytica]